MPESKTIQIQMLPDGGAEFSRGDMPVGWYRNAEVMATHFACALDEIAHVRGLLRNLPSIEEVRTALAANRSMKDGKVVRDQSYCQCDPEVGACPCEYCAIHDALVPVYRILTALPTGLPPEAGNVQPEPPAAEKGKEGDDGD